MNKQHKMKVKCIISICSLLLLGGCTVKEGASEVEQNTNIDKRFTQNDQVVYPTMMRAKVAPENVVYSSNEMDEDMTYQYYYLYDDADSRIGSIGIEFEEANVEVYGLPEDITVIKNDRYYYVNIWTGPGENRNYIYHAEDNTLQQLAYGGMTLTEDYLYIQGIVLTVDGGAPLNIYTKDGKHVSEVTNNSIEFKLLNDKLYYVENEMIEDENGSYKLHSLVKEAELNGDNGKQVCEVIGDTIPVIHEGYVTYEDNGSTYSVEFVR